MGAGPGVLAQRYDTNPVAALAAFRAPIAGVQNAFRAFVAVLPDGVDFASLGRRPCMG